MKVTDQKKKKGQQLAQGAELVKQMSVRVPKDFIFLLCDKLVNDLSSVPTASGDLPILSHPDINLSEVKKAIRRRNLPELLQATSIFSARCISEEWSDKPEIAFGLYQLHTLLKKYPLSQEENALNAYRSFCKYESRCETYNKQNFRAIVSLNKRHPDYLSFIEEIREDIRRCLGDRPPLQRVFDSAKHGPGTALGLNSPMVTEFFKWSELPYTVSPKALPLAQQAIESNPQWIGALIDRYRTRSGNMFQPISMPDFWQFVFKVTNYCRYSTVPKSAVTDRSIGVEPVLNVFLQLGVDREIRRCLRKWGINLNSQSMNQILAMLSSITNDDATIDLEGASDCVSIMVAFMLLPIEWFDLLMDLRSENILISEKFTEGKGEIIKPLHKISAMGNGYTFALESLIFAAIARTTMRRNKIKGNLAVFGDDIIVPRTAAPLLIDNLELFGFKVNSEKTFISGPFRESCGVDCLLGTNIRPFFLKKPVVDVRDIWYIHNSLRVLECRLPEYWELSFNSTKAWLYNFIPKELRNVVGPPSESLDTYLHIERSRYDRSGCCKHLAITPIAMTFNDRAPDWFFRKLMVSLRPTNYDSQERLREAHVAKIFGGVVDLQAGWKTGGSVSNNMRKSTSAFDVTLRGVVKLALITQQTWRR